MREWSKDSQEKLSEFQIEAFRRLDTCTVADAIASLDVRLRNQGYSNASVRCMSAGQASMVGYAVTGCVRSSEPPVVGHHFVERLDWFKHIRTVPEPRVAVLQDLDSSPGRGAFWDDVHARIHLRLGCVGAVTNGAVRDLPKIRATGFHVFAGNISAAHGYAHIVDVGHPVEVGGLVISTGDVIHGDMHGIVKVPMEVVTDLPGAAERVRMARKRLAALCDSPDFSLERLKDLLKDLE